MQTKLKWTFVLLIPGKYLGTVVGALLCAAGIVLHDRAILTMGTGATLMAAIFAVIQSGLLERRPWARYLAIGFSILRIPSIFVPFAILSLRDLFSHEVKDLFRVQTDGGVSSRLLWKHHRRVGLLYATALAIFLSLGFTYGRSQRHRSTTQAAAHSGLAPGEALSAFEERARR